MNLPIKLVDLVTLLFLSLLVVIIIFIILQRNIKRFKQRNVKDPHFVTCKSIPKPLKDSIIRKHQKSHEYIDPPLLFTRTYQGQAPNEVKSMVIRMKAFDTSKCLENALSECNFRRPSSVKFEEFVEDLIEFDDKALPKDLLKTFRKLYISALFDPQPFTVDKLRELNRTINKIIERLANEMDESNRMFIMRHLLDLDAQGDFDLKKYMESNAYLKHRQPLGGNLSGQQREALSSSKKFGKSTTAETIVDSQQQQTTTTTGKSGKSGSKLSKDFFHHKKSGSSDLTNKENAASSSISMNVLGPAAAAAGTSAASGSASSSAAVTRRREKTPTSRQKYEEIKDTSFVSIAAAAKASSSSSSGAPAGNVHTERSSLLTSDPDDNDQTLRWSAANESIKNYDSENEEIPLVSVKKPTHHKKKSSHGTIMANIISSTTSGGGGGSASTSSSNPFSTSNVEYSGALNQGFNETNI